MTAALSRDLRERIVAAYEAGGVRYADVAERFQVSPGVVGKLVRQQRREGTLAPHTDRCGRKPAIRDRSEAALKQHVREHPDATLAERRRALGLCCSLKTVWMTLRRLGGRFKKSRGGRPSRTAPTWPAPGRTGGRAGKRSTRND